MLPVASGLAAYGGAVTFAACGSAFDGRPSAAVGGVATGGRPALSGRRSRHESRPAAAEWRPICNDIDLCVS